jgi:hypothetical protein
VPFRVTHSSLSFFFFSFFFPWESSFSLPSLSIVASESIAVQILTSPGEGVLPTGGTTFVVGKSFFFDFYFLADEIHGGSQDRVRLAQLVRVVWLDA